MQIQGNGEIGSTKRKFYLSGVPLIESRLYYALNRGQDESYKKALLKFAYFINLLAILLENFPFHRT